MADLSVLKKVGMNIDELPAEQREAIQKLDQSEIDALASIREKLNSEGEVSGYAASSRLDGNFVW